MAEINMGFNILLSSWLAIRILSRSERIRSWERSGGVRSLSKWVVVPLSSREAVQFPAFDQRDVVLAGWDCGWG